MNFLGSPHTRLHTLNAQLHIYPWTPHPQLTPSLNSTIENSQKWKKLHKSRSLDYPTVFWCLIHKIQTKISIMSIQKPIHATNFAWKMWHSCGPHMFPSKKPPLYAWRFPLFYGICGWMDTFFTLFLPLFIFPYFSHFSFPTPLHTHLCLFCVHPPFLGVEYLFPF